MNTTIWQAAIWITLFFVILSVFLQYLAKGASQQEANRMNKLIAQNKKLSDNLLELHNQISNLNRDLERLTRENQILKQAVRALHDRVNNLQIQIQMKPKEEDNATSNN